MQGGKEPAAKRIRLCTNTSHGERSATTYCAECKAFFCDECKAIHERMLWPHKGSVIENITSMNRIGLCHIHRDCVLSSFCPSHYELCCTKCIINKNGRHNGCNTIPLIDDEAVQIMKQNLSANVNLFLSKIKAVKSTTEVKLKERQDAFDKNIQSVREQIENMFREIRVRIDSREQILLKALEKTRDEYSLVRVMGELASIDESHNAVVAGRDAMGWKVNDTVHMCGIVARDINVRSEMGTLDSLEIPAKEKLENVPELTFSYDDSILYKLGSLGKILGYMRHSNGENVVDNKEKEEDKGEEEEDEEDEEYVDEEEEDEDYDEDEVENEDEVYEEEEEEEGSNNNITNDNIVNNGNITNNNNNVIGNNNGYNGYNNYNGYNVNNNGNTYYSNIPRGYLGGNVNGPRNY